jgi:hypothetical protein
MTKQRTRLATWRAVPLGVVLATALGLTACETVQVAGPVGGEPMALVAAEWEGEWWVDGTREECYRLEVVEAEPGRLEAVSCEESRGEGTDPSELIVVDARRAGSHQVFFLTASAQGASGDDVIWWLARKSGDVLLLWSPSTPMFRDLIESGQLPGRTDADHVWLDALDAGQLDGLVTTSDRFLFDWRDPTVLVRSTRSPE